MTSSRAIRPWAGVVAVALLATACTATTDVAEPPAQLPAVVPADEPSPVQSGLSVALVLPPTSMTDDALLEAMASDLVEVGSEFEPDVRELRTVRPDGPEFVGDMAHLLAEQGTQLVCVVGAVPRLLVEELAQLYPELSFCGASLQLHDDLEDSVDAVELRNAELGYVIGVGAAAASEAGVVGVVLGSGELPHVPFRDGLLHGLGDVEVLRARTQAGDDVAEVVQRLLDEGADVLVVDGVADADRVLEAAGDALVLTRGTRADAVPDDRLVLSWEVDWPLALKGTITGRLAERPARRATLGFREGVFEVHLGDSASSAVQASVAAAVSAVEEGTYPGDVMPPSLDRHRPGSEAPDDPAGNGGGVTPG